MVITKQMLMMLALMLLLVRMLDPGLVMWLLLLLTQTLAMQVCTAKCARVGASCQWYNLTWTIMGGYRNGVVTLWEVIVLRSKQIAYIAIFEIYN